MMWRDGDVLRKTDEAEVIEAFDYLARRVKRDAMTARGEATEKPPQERETISPTDIDPKTTEQ